MDVALALFDHFQLHVDGVAVKFATEHSRALLAYLAMQPGVHPRALLAALLWPERPDATARQNLRQALVNLKRTLQPFPHLAARLTITPHTIELHAGVIPTDALRFAQLYRDSVAHPHVQGVPCPECITRLEQAVELYTGEFLRALVVKNSVAFEEWQLFLRERFHRQALEMLDMLTDHAETMADYRQMAQHARRQLALEAWHEAAHRQLMRALALDEQSTAALAQYATCRRVLAQELGIPPSPATTALYEAIKRGDYDGKWQIAVEVAGGEAKNSATLAHHAAQPGPSPARASHNLPRPLTRFVGREHEIEEVIQRLADPDARLLTLVGVGGIGKTRLALEVGHTLQTRGMPPPAARAATVPFPDGTCFVPLAPLSSGTMLAPAIATALGIEPGSDPLRTLVKFLRNKTLLLILDNVEHLPDGVSLVVELLEQAPHVQVLATSREWLHVRGEQRYAVPPLIHAKQGDLDEAITWSAVRLFVERARQVLPNFKVTAENLPAVLRICELVQGMPLGLEMAAARGDVLAVEEIAQEIGRSADFLVADYTDLPARQHSMRAVFDWSWRLLGEEEAVVLRQLAVFRGDFTQHAAEIVCGASPRMLNGFVNKSVLQRALDASENPATGTWRYAFHPLLGQFAQEKLAADAEEWTQSATRHSEYYLAFVAAREQRLMRHEPRQAMTEIQAELDNVRQAWQWAREHQASATLDLAAYALWQFYLLAGPPAEAAEAFHQAALSLHDAAGDGQEDALAARALPIVSKLYALSAYILSGAHINYDEAMVQAQRAISLAAAAQPHATAQQAAALGRLVLGQTLALKREYGAAQEHLEQVRDVVQGMLEPEEVWSEIAVQVRIYLAGIARISGEYLSAKAYLSECLQIAQRLGKLRAEVHVQLNLANVLWHMHEGEAALHAYAQALALSLTLGYRWGEATARHEAAIIYGMQGQYAVALAHAGQALTLFVQINEPLKQALVLAKLVQLYGCFGQFARAAEYQAQLVTIRQQLYASEVDRQTLVAGARFALTREDYDQAFQEAHQLWQLLEATGRRLELAEALTLLGQAQIGLGLTAAAAENLTQALALFDALGVPARAAEAQAGLAEIALANGDHSQAMHFAEALYATLEKFPDAGVYEPFPAYLTCYRVLATRHDPRAHACLRRAYAMLQQYAASHDDDELRASFLENVAAHRQLIATYAEVRAQMALDTAAP